VAEQTCDCRQYDWVPELYETRRQLEYLHVSLSGPSATVGTLAASASADSDIGRLKLNRRF